MFTYVVQYFIIIFMFKFIRVMIQSLFTFNSSLVFQNRICRINTIPKTNLNCQLLFYTLWYIIGSLGLIDTFKGWRQTTETKTIRWILTIFKHWGINVKFHLFHIFGIDDWDYKHIKFIYIFCFIMTLTDFLIEIRFTFAKTFLQSNEN